MKREYKMIVINRDEFVDWILDGENYMNNIADHLKGNDYYELTIQDLFNRAGYIPKRLVLNWDAIKKYLTPEERKDEEITEPGELFDSVVFMNKDD